MISKTGIASLLLGLVILAAAYFSMFASAGPWAFLVAAFEGGVILLGLFLAVVGILMLAL